MPSPTALIVQADRLSSESVRRAILIAASGAKIITAHSASDALAHLKRRRFSLAVVGTDLPDVDGLEVARRIVAARSALHVVLLVEQRDSCIDHVARQLRLDAIIDARVESQAGVGAALRRVLSGKQYFSKQRWPVSFNGTDAFQKLTPRELAVLAIVGGGSDNIEAAARLDISQKTVQTHRQQIMRKLRVTSRAELIRAAIASGIVRFTGERVSFPGLAYVRAIGERK